MKLSELLNFESNKKRLEEIRNNRRNIVPFIGTGISKGCGLYTWRELLHKLAVDFLLEDEINSLEANGDLFVYADRIVEAAGNSDMIMKKIRDIFSETDVTLTEIPYLLISNFSRMVVTTNYDTILEDSSINSPLGLLKPLLPCLVGQMNETIQINDRCLLKLHGSVEETQSFIFTTEQYSKFYGEKGILPAYLMRIFSGKKVLFVGCSLDKDYTLKILEKCVKQNRSISHYAIVEYPSNKDKQIKRKRKLTRLGIEPIYYPEGKFESVNQIINYLAEENHFISSMEQILIKILGDNPRFQLKIILSLMKESYYKTALKFPELLDIDSLKNDFTDEILEFIGISRSQSDTLLQICKDGFSAYVKSGYLRCENETITCFFDFFEDKVLKETDIESLMEKKWSINRSLISMHMNDLAWIKNLSDRDINKYAYDLTQKLQYSNGMNFAEIAPVYEMAKHFIDLVYEKLDFDIRIKLLNSLGQFGHYFSDSKRAVSYLQKCIDELEKSKYTDRKHMLFKAKCYSNIAIAKSLSSPNLLPVLEASEKDISIKREYNESDKFYSRSLNFYATVLKELNPFEACDIYIEAADIKEKLISTGKSKEQIRELTASWATTIFNIGLLSKDVELYELAYKIVCYANKYRFKTFDYCNRDYCSSINVHAELELFTHKKQNIEWLINGVESRMNLPEGFSETKVHTWYVCAYYYYLKKEFKTAIKYVNKSLGAAKKDGAIVDFRQDIRTKLLLGNIRSAQAKVEPTYSKEAETIYKDIINSIINLYGNDSFYLIAPLRCMMSIYKRKDDKAYYNELYSSLTKKYSFALKEIEEKLIKFIEDLNKN